MMSLVFLFRWVHSQIHKNPMMNPQATLAITLALNWLIDITQNNKPQPLSPAAKSLAAKR